jgi:hypothetical protein
VTCDTRFFKWLKLTFDPDLEEGGVPDGEEFFESLFHMDCEREAGVRGVLDVT